MSFVALFIRHHLLRAGVLLRCVLAFVALVQLPISIPAAAPQAGRLVIGYGHVPPLSYRDADMAPAGFAIDVLNEAARREGIQLIWRRVAGSEQIEQDLKRGTLDVLAAGMDTPHRRGAFFVSDPWWFTELSLLTRRDAGVRRPEDLDGKRIALASPAYRFLAERSFPGAELSVPPDVSKLGAKAAFIAVCSADAEAALVTHTDIHERLLLGLEECRGVGLNTVESSAVMNLSVIARRGKEGAALRLRRRIDELTADGTLAAIASRHPPIPTQSAVRLAETLRARYDRRAMTIWLASLVVLLILSGLFIFRQRQTQRALRQSEARYRLLVEASPIGVVIGEIAGGNYGRLVHANEAFLRGVGYTRTEVEAGRVSWSDLTPAEFASIDEAAIAQAKATGLSATYEKECVRKDGTRLPVLFACAAVGDGRKHAVAFVIDLTERKGFEARLRETQKLESVGLLAGGIAHEFNNILTAVVGNLSIAIEDLCEGCGVKRFLNEATQGAERAAELTKQLLAYAGKGAFVRRAVDVSEAVHETLGLLNASLPKKTGLREDLAADLPAVIMDPQQCRQIVMNLVVNGAEAIDASRTGSVTVRTWAEDSAVILEVKDTGSGMDDTTKARMFDPFFTTKFIGRGLGLAAVQGIVRTLKGSIGVESAPGVGTCIQVRLPAVSAPVARPKRTAAHVTRGQDRAAVLVIDDEPGIRALARSILAPRGYKVIEAQDGRQAIELLTRNGHEIGVAILDLTMPELNGNEALSSIRVIRPDLQIIASSGHAGPEVMRAFEGQGVAAFLPKPYCGSQLLNQVEALLPQPGRV
jgi:PAS domain S-box-containing protein